MSIETARYAATEQPNMMESFQQRAETQTCQQSFVNFGHCQADRRLQSSPPAPRDSVLLTSRNPKFRDKEIHFGGCRGKSVYESGAAAVAATTIRRRRRRGRRFPTAQQNLS